MNNEFYSCIQNALKDFSKNEENHDVYAIVLDCDSSVGDVVLQYRNRSSFESELSTYEEYENEFGLAVYGLYGSEYEPGEFEIIDYQKTGLVKHFMDSYYYFQTGCSISDKEPINDIKDSCTNIFRDMVVSTINRLKPEIKNPGIHTTDNFIIFHCDHDRTYECRDKMIGMTVDKKIMEDLIK